SPMLFLAQFRSDRRRHRRRPRRGGRSAGLSDRQDDHWCRGTRTPDAPSCPIEQGAALSVLAVTSDKGRKVAFAVPLAGRCAALDRARQRAVEECYGHMVVAG